MSQSYMVECPSCHARGELSDPTLIGKAISCPACNVVFTLPVPEVSIQPVPDEEPSLIEVAEITETPATESVVPPPVDVAPPAEIVASPTTDGAAPAEIVPVAPLATPVAAPVLPASQAEIMPPAEDSVQPQFPGYGGIPSAHAIDPSAFNFAGMGPSAGATVASPFPGIAETQFAQSLPEPSVRESVRKKKGLSPQTSILIGCGIGGIVVFAIAVFLLGDPFRNSAKKHNEVVAEDKARKEKKPVKRPANDTSLSDKLKEIDARMKAPASDSTPSK